MRSRRILNALDTNCFAAFQPRNAVITFEYLAFGTEESGIMRTVTVAAERDPIEFHPVISYEAFRLFAGDAAAFPPLVC